MRPHLPSGLSRRTGITLVELLIVLLIISILAGLLVPAVQHARESARRAACQGNLHQLWIVMRQGLIWKKAPPQSVGGWSIAILPLIEQRAAADDFKRKPSLKPGEISSFAFTRPEVLSCPSAYNGPSRIPPIPVAHYIMENSCVIGDLPYGSLEPWVIGQIGPMSSGPHDGGYNVTDSRGAITWKSGE
jgi:prepilin-type N-terminal cleavage/methylation domain-containing protein